MSYCTKTYAAPLIAQYTISHEATEVFINSAEPSDTENETLRSVKEKMRGILNCLRCDSQKQSAFLSANYDGADVFGGLRDNAFRLEIGLKSAAEQIKGYVTPVDERNSGPDMAPRFSHSDWYDDIVALIGDQKENWLSNYSEFLEQYAGILSEVADILAELSNYVEAVDDSKTQIKFNLLFQRLGDLLESLNGTDGVVMEFESDAAAQSFLKELGLDGFEVMPGSHAIVVSASHPLAALKEHLDKISVWPSTIMDNAKYNAWLEAKNSLFEQIQSAGRILGEKNQRAMSQYDNMVRILSGAVETIGQADERIVSNF